MICCEMYLQYMHQRHLYCTFACTSPPAAGLFSRFLLGRTQEPRPYTAVHFWAPAGLRGACSGRPKSRELAVFQGIAFRLAEPRRTLENPQKKCQPFLSAALSYLYHVSQALHFDKSQYNSSRTSRFAFVTATDGACVCARVCAMFPVVLGKLERTHNVKNGVINWFRFGK